MKPRCGAAGVENYGLVPEGEVSVSGVVVEKRRLIEFVEMWRKVKERKAFG